MEVSISTEKAERSYCYFGTEVETALQDYLDERNDVIPEEGSENALFLSLQRKRMNVRSVENTG